MPPDELTVYGPPIGTDREGNIIGAFLYGGTDNGGYVFRYDPVSDTMITVKDWLDGSPGVMTNCCPLLHHSNGNYYGVSESGGGDFTGRFFSLNPATGKAVALAKFRRHH